VRVRNHEATESDRRPAPVFLKPKTLPSRRPIPIPQEIIVELKAHNARPAPEKLLRGQAYQNQGLGFCWPEGRPLAPRNVTKHFDRMLQQAGMPHRRLHDARHTFTTVRLDLKASPKARPALCGHRKIATTMDLYAQVSWDVQQQERGRLDYGLRRNPSPSGATGAVGASHRHRAGASLK
jgi:integrase